MKSLRKRIGARQFTNLLLDLATFARLEKEIPTEPGALGAAFVKWSPVNSYTYNIDEATAKCLFTQHLDIFVDGQPQAVVTYILQHVGSKHNPVASKLSATQCRDLLNYPYQHRLIKSNKEVISNVMPRIDVMRKSGIGLQAWDTLSDCEPSKDVFASYAHQEDLKSGQCYVSTTGDSLLEVGKRFAVGRDLKKPHPGVYANDPSRPASQYRPDVTSAERKQQLKHSCAYLTNERQPV